MRRSLILEVVVRAEFHTLVVVALYLLFAGHNQPGGGFAGGLVAGAALALRFLASGIDDVRRVVRVAPTTILGLGLLFALLTAIIPLLSGHALLEHGYVILSAPLLGEAKVTSALTFDMGVFLVVVGLILFVLESFGATEDDPSEVAAGDPAQGGAAMTLVPALVVAVLFASGTYLLLQRTLTRIILGVGLIGNGANLLLLVSAGPAGRPPIIGSDAPADFADPVPQALALTAIVITFGLTAFLLALAYRSWQLTHDDEVEDDIEDRRIARLRGEFDPDIDELNLELAELERVDLDDLEPEHGEHHKRDGDDRHDKRDGEAPS